MATEQTGVPRIVVLAGIALVIAAILVPFVLNNTPSPSGVERTSSPDQTRRFQAAAGFLATIKSSLRDPASLDVETVLTDDAPTLICVKYRAKNGFGGIGVETAVLVNGLTSTSGVDWATHCANRGLHDMTYVRRVL